MELACIVWKWFNILSNILINPLMIFSWVWRILLTEWLISSHWPLSFSEMLESDILNKSKSFLRYLNILGVVLSQYPMPNVNILGWTLAQKHKFVIQYHCWCCQHTMCCRNASQDYAALSRSAVLSIKIMRLWKWYWINL